MIDYRMIVQVYKDAKIKKWTWRIKDHKDDTIGHATDKDRKIKFYATCFGAKKTAQSVVDKFGAAKMEVIR